MSSSSNNNNNNIKLGLLATGAALVTAFAVKKLFFDSSSSNEDPSIQPPQVTTRTAKISQLYVFPVKSCSGVQVSSFELLETGAKFDREWAVVDAKTGKIVTQREKPIMRRITAAIDEAQGNLVLTYAPPKNNTNEETKMVTVSISQTNENIAEFKKMGGDSNESHILPVILWGIPGQLWDEGDEVAKFFSTILETPCRLGRIFLHRRPSQSISHKAITKSDDIISNHDFSSLHVITEEGVEWVKKQAEHVKNTADEPVDSLRFRPNIVVSGVPFPEEDHWKSFDVKSNKTSETTTTIRVAKHCGRCSIPTILSNSDRDKAYFPTSEIKKLRNGFYSHQRSMEFDGKQKWPMFGLNVFHSHNDDDKTKQIISVGDIVEVKTFATKKEQMEFEA